MRYKTFVVRLVWSRGKIPGRVTGQISDPQTGWRRPFANADELWELLTRAEAPRRQDSPSPDEK